MKILMTEQVYVAFYFAMMDLQNRLYLETGCNVPTAGDLAMVVQRGTADMIFPQSVRIGDDVNPSADLHVKQSSEPSPDPTAAGIRLEESSGSDQWQIWNSNDFLSFGRNGTRLAYIDLSGNWVPTSDLRLKRRIQSLGSVMEKVRRLNPVSYLYKHQEDIDQRSIGFIAQEVMTLFPETVKSENESQYGLSYKDFSVIAIKAIQEQQDEIDELRNELETLRKMILEQGK